MQKGDRVIRKNHKGGEGIIEAVIGKKARVRWLDALKPFRGGYADNHSLLLLSALLPVTEDNLAKHKAVQGQKQAKYRAAVEAECGHWRFCRVTHARVDDNGFCPKCQATHPQEDTYSWRAPWAKKTNP